MAGVERVSDVLKAHAGCFEDSIERFPLEKERRARFAPQQLKQQMRNLLSYRYRDHYQGPVEKTKLHTPNRPGQPIELNASGMVYLQPHVVVWANFASERRHGNLAIV